MRVPPAILLVLAAALLAPSALAVGEEAHEVLAAARETVESTTGVDADEPWESAPSTEHAGENVLEATAPWWYSEEPPAEEAPPESHEPSHEHDAPARHEPEPRTSSLIRIAVPSSIGLGPLTVDTAPLLDVVPVPLPLVDVPAATPAGTAAPAPGDGVTTAGAAIPDAIPEAAVAPSAVALALASAAVVAPAAASTAASAGAAWWERVRRFGWLAVLYTRIAKDKLLDHGRRDALLAHVRDNPGLTLTDLAEATQIPRNTATYHLNRLEKEGIVASARKGRARLYFAVGGEARRSQADAFAALRHDNGMALARAVGDAPGIDQQALCQKLGLAPSLVHWHADRLLACGVLVKEREGRHVRYHPGPAFALVSAAERAPTTTSAAADGGPSMAC